MAKAEFPAVPEALLKALEAKFPGVVPSNPEATFEDFKLLQGEQRVIAFLKQQYRKQNESISEK